jgi:hypothetical protein
MAAADKRVEELLDRWMASLELHAQYLKLDDAAYALVEPWPRHQRPNAWIVELARKRLLELRALLTQRATAGDEGFAEALELMSFLTNLLGSEHIERFIPLATGSRPDTSASGTIEQPRPRARPQTVAQRSGVTPPVAAATMSAAPPARHQVSSPAKPAAPGHGARLKTPSPPPPRRTARTGAAQASRPAPQAQAPPPPAPDAISKQVIADAVRMLEWGREWPALAGLIARMADRPPEPEVWKILRAYRNQIMTKARRPTG